MKRALLVLLLVLPLAACQLAKMNANLLTVPRTSGSFISAPAGKEFSPVEPVDPRNAIVYIYRPVSEWGYGEVQAPTFFLNDDMLFGVKSGAFSWIEIAPGSYDLYARRPLSILFLKTIFDLRLKVEGGKVYYFRYSELHPLRMDLVTSKPEEYASAGPLQEVPQDVGQREIQHLKLDENGIFYGGGKVAPRWAPFYTYPADGGVSQTLLKP